MSFARGALREGYLERQGCSTHVTETVLVRCVVVVTIVTHIRRGPGTATISVTSGTAAQYVLASGVLNHILIRVALGVSRERLT